MNRRIAAVSALVILVAAAGIYLWRVADTSPFVVMTGVWIGHGPLWVAQEKGFFKEEGVNVRLLQPANASAVAAREAIAARKADATAISLDEHVVGVSQGLPVKVTLALSTSNGADGIVAAKGISALSDLKGKTIAAEVGGENYFFTMHVLELAGLSQNDVTLRSMDGGAAGRAFLAGSVDAAATWEPYLSQAKKRPGGHVFIDTSDPRVNDIMVDVLSVRNDVIADRPDDVRAINRAWYRAVEYMREHPTEANRIVAEALHIAPEEAGAQLKGLRLLGPASNRSFMSLSGRPRTVLDVTGRIAEHLKRRGVILQAPELKTLIAPASVLADEAR